MSTNRHLYIDMMIRTIQKEEQHHLTHILQALTRYNPLCKYD